MSFVSLVSSVSLVSFVSSVSPVSPCGMKILFLHRTKFLRIFSLLTLFSSAEIFVITNVYLI